MTGCLAYSIVSDAANEMRRARRSTTAVYRRKRRFWYNQVVHVSWEGKLLVSANDHESFQEAYWTWFENESCLEYGRWDKSASGGLKISSFFTHIALKESELVLVGALPLFKRYRYIRACCSFLSLYIVQTCFSLYGHLNCCMTSREEACWFKLHTIQIRILSTKKRVGYL